jgi:hypothetical protein
MRARTAVFAGLIAIVAVGTATVGVALVQLSDSFNGLGELGQRELPNATNVYDYMMRTDDAVLDGERLLYQAQAESRPRGRCCSRYPSAGSVPSRPPLSRPGDLENAPATERGGQSKL